MPRFWAMVEGGVSGLPTVMPMTPAVAPRFTARRPRAIDAALDRFQDGTRNVMSLDHWLMMAEPLGGVEAMGGVAGRP